MKEKIKFKERFFKTVASIRSFLKRHKGLILIPTMILCCLLILVLAINVSIKVEVKPHVYAPQASDIPDGDYDCILVLGAGLRADGSPSDMLRDRIIIGCELYQRGYSNRLLMSGDHATTEYDEVNTMKKYAIEQFDIPSGAIFMDHAGFSTYESLYRARDVFGAKRVLIVTQEYHMYRALYIADKLGLEAVGVSADRFRYAGQLYRDIREIAARCKDFFSVLCEVQPTYLGDPISLDENGDITNDMEEAHYGKNKTIGS